MKYYEYKTKVVLNPSLFDPLDAETNEYIVEFQKELNLMGDLGFRLNSITNEGINSSTVIAIFERENQLSGGTQLITG